MAPTGQLLNQFVLPSGTTLPFGITSGPDGKLWFTENNVSNDVGNITTTGVITEFPIPTANSTPAGITSGPDGNLWFTEASASTIGRITPSGDITEFTTPTMGSFPLGITSGPDGNLWFTESARRGRGANQIGRITPDGIVTEYTVPTPFNSPIDITSGPDGNMWFTEGIGNIGRITVEPIDLAASIDNSQVRPTQAPNLQLNVIYSGEQLTVPVTVTDAGSDSVSGTGAISFFVSPSPTYDPSTAIPVGHGNLKGLSINLATGEQDTFTATITIPSDPSMSPGDQLYVLAKLTSNIKETDAANGVDSNNVAATDQVEYLGAPTRPAVFQNGTFFRIATDTLNEVTPPELAGVPFDGLHFTAAFEVPGGYDNFPNSVLAPYVVSGHPTIGIGLDLVTGLSDAAITSALAADVRAYYLKTYKIDLSKKSDAQIVRMLKQEATIGNVVQALSRTDAQQLYMMSYADAQQAAMSFVGSNWSVLTETAQWVITDLAFNANLSGFSNFQADLQGADAPDYLRAAFDLLDSKRTQQIQYDRSLADFEYLLQGFTADLGTVVG
jgi:hypothetical protein